MTVYLKELKQSLKSWSIWTGSIVFMLIICIGMFNEIKGEMDNFTNMFASMGGFSAAFGMDQLNFGEIMGFYGIECGNILGIGGGFFAAMIGISILSKEEKERTAEFLFTHPISRASILTQKLLSVLTQILTMNIFITLISAVSFSFIGENAMVKEFFLMHLAYFIMQIQIACMCFGISAFIRRGGLGLGLGLASVLYFLNIICNISDKAEFLKYITPFAYTEASDIIIQSKIDSGLVLIGIAMTFIGIVVGFAKYLKKDIAA